MVGPTWDTQENWERWGKLSGAHDEIERIREVIREKDEQIALLQDLVIDMGLSLL